MPPPDSAAPRHSGPTPRTQVVLGVLGTGAIAEALVTGLCGGEEFDGTVLLSLRNRERSARLADRFDQVEVVERSQSIVDRSSRVLLAVRPEQLPGLLGPLRFRPDQTILSLVAGVTLQQLRASLAPATRVHRAIPMPPVERREGPLPLVPPDVDLESFLAPLGSIIPVEDENTFQALAAASAVMASYFEIVAGTARWLEAQGTGAENATNYATALFGALSSSLEKSSPATLAKLSEECLTRGGLNEQVLRELRESRWFETLDTRLDRILARLLATRLPSES